MANPGPATQGLTNYVAQLTPPGLPSRVVFPPGAEITAVTAPGNGTMSFQYMPVTAPFTASRFDALFGISLASSATANTFGLGLTAVGGIYTNSTFGTGTATTAGLSALSTGSQTASFSIASNNSGNTALLQAAVRAFSMPMSVTAYPGEYLAAYALSTATISTGTATTALGQTVSIYGGANLQTASNYAPEFTNATATSLGLFAGMGVHSVTQSIAQSSYALSDINQTGANVSGANINLIFRNV